MHHSSRSTSRRALITTIGRGAGVALLLAASRARGASDTLTLATEGRGTVIEIEIKALAALPQATVRTETDFSDGMVSFRGPLVRDVLDQTVLGQAETLRFTAANGYWVDIPASDFRSYDAILALEADGHRLSRRDKGPVWLIYPISTEPVLRDPIYVSRLIWQVTMMEAL